MALTPDQITAQNFKDFYMQILPYLGKGGGGGSMNYSTDEQVVGTWIDGKPLYQKSGTYTFTETKTDTTVNMPIALANIKDCIEASATIGGAIIPIGSTGAYGIITLGAVTSTYVQLRLCGNQALASGDTVLFTIRYTKTTD